MSNRIPLGWTRTSNINGFKAGTYDVINFWRRGPDQEVWSNVAIYLEGDEPFGWASNLNKYMSGEDDVIACWPAPRGDSIPLFL